MAEADERIPHWQTFFDNCADVLCVLDSSHKLTLVNPAFQSTFGCSAGKLTEERFSDLIEDEERSRTREVLQALARSGGNTIFSTRSKVNGREMIFEWRAIARAGTDAIYLRGIDVTERRAQQLSQRELAYRHEAILAVESDIIAEVDLNYTYTWLNAAGHEFFGPGVIGKTADFFFEESKDRAYAIVQPLFDGSAEPIYLETWQRRHDGASRLLAWWCRSLKDADGKVIGALSTARDITDSKRTGDKLRDTETRARTLFDNAAQGILTVDARGRIQSLNPMAEKMFGYTAAELRGATVEMLLPEAARDVHEKHRAAYVEHPRTRPMGMGLDLTARRKDGTEFPVEIGLSGIETSEGPIVVAFISDISERKKAASEKARLERGLEHATKMEAVGRLAGGIAHDFNNLLTALSGFSEIVLDELTEDHPLHEGAMETFKTCQRSQSLVRQLLAVSRRQILTPRPLDLNAKIAEIQKMLRTVLGEDIELEVKLDPSVGMVLADESQMEQVILNLVVNARDAMPTGGLLEIETAQLELDDQAVKHKPDGKPGSHVLLSVSDTGHGMDEYTYDHMFEPFFTTKERGKGTGLGLATVYGIVNQSGGHVWVDSEQNKGTTFQIYLPSIANRECSSVSTSPRTRKETGSETVLVVEDENTVRLVAVTALRKAGYQVLEARDGEEALSIADAADDPIHVVLTDVVMPRVNGPELVARLSKQHPRAKAIFMSGHADDALVDHGVPAGTLSFLEKPFTREELLTKVRESLEPGT